MPIYLKIQKKVEINMGMKELKEEILSDDDILQSDDMPVTKYIKCNNCSDEFVKQLDFFEIVIKCNKCDSTNIEIVYEGFSIVKDEDDGFEEEFEWDEDMVDVIEKEMKIEDGYDFVRSDTGVIICLSDKAEKLLLNMEDKLE